MKPSPNPNWKPGDKISAPQGKTLQIDPANFKYETIYKLLIGGVTPRPIAFVSTISPEGVTNLAPFSFFNAVCSNPPSVMFSISLKPNGEKKDSLRNIEANGEFVINSANKWLVEALVHCAGSFPYGVDEMKLAGLTPIASEKIKPLRVKESALQMECEVYKLIPVGDGSPGSSTVVIGRVLLFHILDTVYQNEKVLADQYQSVGRMGGISYCLGEEDFVLSIPKV